MGGSFGLASLVRGSRKTRSTGAGGPEVLRPPKVLSTRRRFYGIWTSLALQKGFHTLGPVDDGSVTLWPTTKKIDHSLGRLPTVTGRLVYPERMRTRCLMDRWIDVSDGSMDDSRGWYYHLYVWMVSQ